MSKLPSYANQVLPSSMSLSDASQNQMQINRLIQEGRDLCRQSEFKSAQEKFEQVLAMQPNHVVALFLLGTAQAQIEQFDSALASFTTAIAVDSQHAESYVNRGKVYKALGRLQDALADYVKAIQINPRFAPAYMNGGNVLQELQRFDEALSYYDRAINIQPEHVQTHINRGIALQKLARFEEAIASSDSALTIKPDYSRAYYHRANALQALGRLDAALLDYDCAIRYEVDFAAAYYNRANLLLTLGRLHEARRSYDAAIRIQPDYPEALANRAIVLLEWTYCDAALQDIEMALALAPDNVDFTICRATILTKLERIDAAIDCYAQAISVHPQYAKLYLNRAELFYAVGRFDDALADYDCAITLEAHCADAYFNRGIILREQHRLEEAIASYQQAIQVQTDFPQAHWNLALCQLLQGNFEEGWRGFEWRWHEKNLPYLEVRRQFSQALWLGDAPLKGKTILLYAEQGLGDTLQFCRYVTKVAQMGARVILEVQPALRQLLQNLDGVSQIVTKGEALPAFDFQCPLGSLPLALQNALSGIPSVPQRVVVDGDTVAKWQTLLGQKTKPRIGLVWRGNPKHKNDRQRSLNLAQLISHLADGLEYISLQQELPSADLALLADNSAIRHFGMHIHDLTDTAALCGLMDIVISVDTSVAHLAGTLERPTWILLPYSPDWRWLLEGQASPWYPTVKLYRQSSNRRWQDVLGQVALDLASKFANATQSEKVISC